MINFNPSEFDRIVNIALNLKRTESYYVRFNGFDGKAKPYGYVADSTLHESAFSDLAKRYENADLLVQVQAGFIQIICDTGGYTQEWHAWQGMQPATQPPSERFSERQGLNKAQPKAAPVFELPWQKRQREEAEKLAAVVALRNTVRSTLGM